MEIGGELFSMALALKLQRVAPSSTASEASGLHRLYSDAPNSDNNSLNVRYNNTQVCYNMNGPIHLFLRTLNENTNLLLMFCLIYYLSSINLFERRWSQNGIKRNFYYYYFLFVGEWKKSTGRHSYKYSHTHTHTVL